LNLESRLQDWLVRDISILDPGLLVMGREVETDFGGFIDILSSMPRATSSSWS
jgi:RecB family endonuclease NucS